MTTRHRFRLLNVFVDGSKPFTGNALAVFEDGSGLSDEQLQALALQFNLSETSFLFPSTTGSATARVRIFTPSFEMPFAGHPTLGTAHVARDLFGAGDRVTLEMKAGLIPVTADGDSWTLRANAPRSRPAEATRAELAAMIGVDERDVRDGAMWIDTGSEQLVVGVTDADVVRRCRPDPALLARHGSNATRAGLVYVWAEGDPIVSRFFFLKNGNVVEDPGTGSACANLGGWFVVARHALPLTRAIAQGALTGRPCKLGLHVDANAQIFVTGSVVEIGRGEIAI